LTTSIDDRIRDRASAALDVLVEAARQGGEVALRDFRWHERTSATVRLKHGGSPVTDADLAVDRHLRGQLGAAFPEAGWLSEETADDLGRLDCAELIIVDPIDGTRAFLGGDPRWAVAIALVSDGRPIAGVVHAPALGETYAAAYGCGAAHDGLRLGKTSAAGRARPAAAGPRALIAAVSAASGVEFEVVPRIPSLALRLARVASGELDLAFAAGNCHDWDIAAADVILREAGGKLVGAHGGAIEYNQPRTRHGTLAACRAGLPYDLSAAALAAVRQASA